MSDYRKKLHIILTLLQYNETIIVSFPSILILTSKKIFTKKFALSYFLADSIYHHLHILEVPSVRSTRNVQYTIRQKRKWHHLTHEQLSKEHENTTIQKKNIYITKNGIDIYDYYSYVF